MPKVLTISGMIVAFLIFLLFGLDLAAGITFNKASTAMDVSFVLCSIGLGYLSWASWRELR